MFDPRSRYTGLFQRFADIPLRAHDPRVFVTSGQVHVGASVGGAGWEPEGARMATLGEAIERLCTHRLATDVTHRARFDRWDGPHPAVPPEAWVLLSQEQYDATSFEPLWPSTECDWVLFRDGRGAPRWVPTELAFMDLRPDTAARFAPVISTGWSAHTSPRVAVLRGIQEVLERDATTCAWWGHYEVSECEGVLSRLGEDIVEAVTRPNLRYRFYRIASPHTQCAVMVSVDGADEEGDVFSIGSACRETLADSWQKALLEAIQGRHYVRYLLANEPGADPPRSFADHAVYYSRHRARLASTCLEGAARGRASWDGSEPLGRQLANHPVLYRVMTHPGLASAGSGWHVVRVMIPGMQPLHGDHALPFLGGRAWSGADFASSAPHPFA